MAVTFPAQAKITPSFSEPNLVVTYAQASGCWSLLPDGKPTVKIGSDDLAVYINHLDIRSQAQSSQFAPITTGTTWPPPPTTQLDSRMPTSWP